VLVRLGGELIFIDAGTGLIHAEDYFNADRERFSILLSHPHIDHIVGLTAFPPLFNPECGVDIYAADRGGLSAREQISRLMSVPIWPVGLDDYSPGVAFKPSLPHFAIGQVSVDTMDGNHHPGGSTAYRLSYGGKSIVYCVDFEHSAETTKQLIIFAKDCNLLIYDAQYSDEEYETKHGWGHSTWNEGVKTAERCNAENLVLFHHDPMRTDEQLHNLEQSIKSKFGNATFGKRGQEITL
jgi:phosphoribosyl 1,2-cyclic phosphodiesterase